MTKSKRGSQVDLGFDINAYASRDTAGFLALVQ